MIEFASTYRNTAEASKDFTIREDAAFTLIRRCADGKIQVVDSTELPYIKDEDNATSAAMFAVLNYDESCDVYHYGEYYGTAKYVDMTPKSWFSSMQVVFSMPYFY